ncbi:MAG: DNA polymerase III subunit delta [Patescibacteria group bacterium]
MDEKKNALIYLFHGEDDFTTQEKITRQKKNFLAKHGEFNLTTFNEENFSKESFIETVTASPFLGEKRLIIVEDMVSVFKKEEWEFIEKNIVHIPDTSVLIFQESEKVKDKNPIFGLITTSNILEQKKTFGSSIMQHAKESLTRAGVTIDQNALSLFSDLIGSNTRSAEQEISKIISYAAKSKHISIQDIEKLVVGQKTNNIFALVETLSQRNIKKSQDMLSDFFLSGDKIHHILPPIAYQFRTLLIVSLANTKKIPSSQYSKDFDLKPYTIQKSQGMLRNFSLSSLLKIHQYISECDLGVKTGDVDEETALMTLVTKICLVT